MSTNVTFLSENQLRVLPFLLSAPSITQAAEAAKVSPKLIYRWLQESKAFRDEYRARQMAVADAAMSCLLSHIQKAVDTLVELLDCDTQAGCGQVIAARIGLYAEIESHFKGIILHDTRAEARMRARRHTRRWFESTEIARWRQRIKLLK